MHFKRDTQTPDTDAEDVHPRPEPAGNSPSPHALWAADGPKVEPQTDRPVGNITVMHWSSPGQPGPVNPGQIRALFVQRQDTAGVKAECFSLGSSTHTHTHKKRGTEQQWRTAERLAAWGLRTS